MLGYKPNLSTCLRISSIATTFSDHCVVKLEVNNQKSAGKLAYFYSFDQHMGQKIVTEIRNHLELKKWVLSQPGNFCPAYW